MAESLGVAALGSGKPSSEWDAGARVQSGLPRVAEPRLAFAPAVVCMGLIVKGAGPWKKGTKAFLTVKK